MEPTFGPAERAALVGGHGPSRHHFNRAVCFMVVLRGHGVWRGRLDESNCHLGAPVINGFFLRLEVGWSVSESVCLTVEFLVETVETRNSTSSL
jgi:hypothetical protein